MKGFMSLLVFMGFVGLVGELQAAIPDSGLESLELSEQDYGSAPLVGGASDVGPIVKKDSAVAPLPQTKSYTLAQGGGTWQPQPQIDVVQSPYQDTFNKRREFERRTNEAVLGRVEGIRFRRELELSKAAQSWGVDTPKAQAPAQAPPVVAVPQAAPLQAPPAAVAVPKNVVIQQAPIRFVEDEAPKSGASTLMSRFFQDFQQYRYMAIFAGNTNYEDSTVHNLWSLGVEFGTQGANGFDTSFYLSAASSDLDPYRYVYTQFEQYSAGMGVRKKFLSGAVTPFIGGLAGMSYNVYSLDDRDRGYEYESESVMQFDGGVSAGFEVLVSEGFAMRLEGKKVINFWGDTRDNVFFPDYDYDYFEPEDYYVFGVSAKFSF